VAEYGLREIKKLEGVIASSTDGERRAGKAKGEDRDQKVTKENVDGGLNRDTSHSSFSSSPSANTRKVSVRAPAALGRKRGLRVGNAKRRNCQRNNKLIRHGITAYDPLHVSPKGHFNADYSLLVNSHGVEKILTSSIPNPFASTLLENV
jgi:hypothetical protein